MTYIDLERRFRDLTAAELEDPESLAYQNDRSFGSKTGWPELLEEWRVVLLAEAGSGKTREMEEQARRLNGDGRVAFFVPLEELARDPLSNVLSAQDEKRLSQWLASAGVIAWFFLDAVDELKLTGGKLDQALKRLGKVLDGNLSRARIVVSCRPNDWRPITDNRIFRDRLPLPELQSPILPTGEELFLEPFVEREKSKPPEEISVGDSNASGSKPISFRTVILLPMSERQIEKFATSGGVLDAAALLAEIERERAWTFARRPLDLIELVATWRTYGKLGTRAQQHETNVVAKLKDDPGRADRGVLTEEKARLGAERLALALALTRTRTIRAPEQPIETGRVEGVLDPASILSDWTETERQTLLRRALFDPATYGRIRFHHRSVQEYLAACRLRALRRKGMSTAAAFRLLFSDRYGEHTVIPSMRPIAAWLSLWDDAARAELGRREPEVLLSMGDPGSLTVEARSSVLRSFAEAYGNGGWRGLTFPIDEVRRLAHPELGTTIRDLWNQGSTNVDLRELLIELICEGRIDSCADLAESVTFDPSWEGRHRLTAVRALKALGRNEALQRVGLSLASDEPLWPNGYVPRIAAELFPQFLGAAPLIGVVERTPPPSRRIGGPDFDWALRSIVV